MDTGTVFIIMLGLTFFVMFEGVKALRGNPPYHMSVHEAEQIFNSRVFETEEAVRDKMAEYFHGLEKKIKIAGLSFVLAYVMTSLMFHMINPVSFVWESFGVVFVFFLGPLAIVFVATHEIRSLKRDMINKLNAH